MTADMNRNELNGMELDMVNGGTIDRNTLDESRYNEVGIRTEYHWVWKDEFWLPGGIKTDMKGADEYVKSVVGEQKFKLWKKEHEPSELDGIA